MCINFIRFNKLFCAFSITLNESDGKNLLFFRKCYINYIRYENIMFYSIHMVKICFKKQCNS